MTKSSLAVSPPHRGVMVTLMGDGSGDQVSFGPFYYVSIVYGEVRGVGVSCDPFGEDSAHIAELKGRLWIAEGRTWSDMEITPSEED